MPRLLHFFFWSNGHARSLTGIWQTLCSVSAFFFKRRTCRGRRLRRTRFSFIFISFFFAFFVFFLFFFFRRLPVVVFVDLFCLFFLSAFTPPPLSFFTVRSLKSTNETFTILLIHLFFLQPYSETLFYSSVVGLFFCHQKSINTWLIALLQFQLGTDWKEIKNIS